MGSTNITMEDIKKIFQDMFQQNQETITKKQEEIFRSHENSIMQLISRNTTLTNNLSKEIADLKESLEFTQEQTEEKISKLNEKITSIEICSASRKTWKSFKPLNQAGTSNLWTSKTVPGGTI